jgi:hypothetical protein
MTSRLCASSDLTPHQALVGLLLYDHTWIQCTRVCAFLRPHMDDARGATASLRLLAHAPRPLPPGGGRRGRAEEGAREALVHVRPAVVQTLRTLQVTG